VVTEIRVGTGKPRAQAALEVTLGQGGRVTVYISASASDATRAARPFAPIERSNPRQFELRKRGAHLYVGTIEELCSPWHVSKRSSLRGRESERSSVRLDPDPGRRQRVRMKW
jgi:hypothetical protein